MSWIVLVIIATILDATRIFIDNYTSDVYFKGREAVSQKLFYGYAFIFFALILAIITGFDFDPDYFVSFGLFFISGLLSSLSGIPYYRALELDDSTNIGIFTQLAPVLYLVLGWFFLGETFAPLQLLAFAVILAAPFLIIFTTKKRSRHLKLKAIFYAFLYVFIAVIGNLIFIKENTAELNFLAEITFVLLGKGIGNLIIIYTNPKWRHRFRFVARRNKKVFRPLCANALIGLTKDLTYRLGLTLAPAVALASVASDSAEPIIIFFMGLFLTLIWPRFGREKLDKKSIFVHLFATILVVIGIIILNFIA